MKAWEPKVQLPFKAEPGQVPRKIEIERFVFFPLFAFSLLSFKSAAHFRWSFKEFVIDESLFVHSNGSL